LREKLHIKRRKEEEKEKKKTSKLAASIPNGITSDFNSSAE